MFIAVLRQREKTPIWIIVCADSNIVIGNSGDTTIPPLRTHLSHSTGANVIQVFVPNPLSSVTFKWGVVQCTASTFIP
jgi:hypothetical protein